jgi:hypothetical protein
MVPEPDAVRKVVVGETVIVAVAPLASLMVIDVAVVAVTVPVRLAVRGDRRRCERPVRVGRAPGRARRNRR